MLQWVESISSSSTLDPSPILLHTSDGAVIQTGFMKLQEFAHSKEETAVTSSPGSLKPLIQRKLGSNATFAGTYAAVDYGRHWTVLRSSGLVQCMVHGQPDNLFNLSECRQVIVHNPREMREGAEYSIEVDTSESTLVLKAALPTEHSDWVLSIEQILHKLDQIKLIEGHRKRESGYVALKRLLLTGTGSAGGQTSSASSQLYCLPVILDDMDDVYDSPKHPLPSSSGIRGHTGRHSKPLQKPVPPVRAGTATQEPRMLEECKEESEENLIPLPPRDDIPPPLPPRRDLPPPLPPKRTVSSSSSSSFLQHHRPISSDSCSDPDTDDDYILMMQSALHQSSVPASLSNSHHSSLRAHVSSQSVSQPPASMPTSSPISPQRNAEPVSSDFSSASPPFSPSPVIQCLQSLTGDDGSKSDGTATEAKQLEQQYDKNGGRSLLTQSSPHPISKSVSRQASCTSEGYGSSFEDLSEVSNSSQKYLPGIFN